VIRVEEDVGQEPRFFMIIIIIGVIIFKMQILAVVIKHVHGYKIGI
jgi:hypothetical protein